MSIQLNPRDSTGMRMIRGSARVAALAFETARNAPTSDVAKRVNFMRHYVYNSEYRRVSKKDFDFIQDAIDTGFMALQDLGYVISKSDPQDIRKTSKKSEK